MKNVMFFYLDIVCILNYVILCAVFCEQPFDCCFLT